MSKVNETYQLFDFGTFGTLNYNEDLEFQANHYHYQSIFQNDLDNNVNNVNVDVDFHSAPLSNNYSFLSNSSDSDEETENLANPKSNAASFDMIIDDKMDKMIETSSSRTCENISVYSTNSTKEKKFWTKIEDDLLLGYINKTQNKNWRMVSEYIKTKSPQQCAYRYSKLISDMNKKKWSRKDDIKLIELVETYGSNWGIIAREFGDRSERDVESRYKDKLDPNVKNTKFLPEEDNEIVRLYEEYGNDWFNIARHFKNRNAKMIKKRFQTVLKFNCKKTSKRNRTKSKFANTSCNLTINTDLINASSNASTPRSSLGPTPKSVKSSMSAMLGSNKSTQLSITPMNDNNPFNVDLFFDKEVKSFESNNMNVNAFSDFDILSANYLKIDLHASYANQVENIDKYFSQICLFYTEKSLQLEQAILHKSGFEIDNIVNINSQVSSQVEMLMNKISQMQKERVNITSDQCYKTYIVKYIETILQIIQQIKIKVSLI
jgi:hypothetical protein